MELNEPCSIAQTSSGQLLEMTWNIEMIFETLTAHQSKHWTTHGSPSQWWRKKWTNLFHLKPQNTFLVINPYKNYQKLIVWQKQCHKPSPSHHRNFIEVLWVTIPIGGLCHCLSIFPKTRTRYERHRRISRSKFIAFVGFFIGNWIISTTDEGILQYNLRLGNYSNSRNSTTW